MYQKYEDLIKLDRTDKIDLCKALIDGQLMKNELLHNMGLCVLDADVLDINNSELRQLDTKLVTGIIEDDDLDKLLYQQSIEFTLEERRKDYQACGASGVSSQNSIDILNSIKESIGDTNE